MSPPRESIPNDRKRKTSGDDGKPPKRCVPVLVPTSARPVLLAPIAPAVGPAAGPQSLPLLAPACAPSMQAAYHQLQSLALPIANSHPPVHQQQHSAGLVYTFPQQSLPGPQIFMQSKLRSGKWTSSEEAYALELIDFFDKGLAVECENGSTLRSYLAKKLHCSPMRISKKFAGKGIGKKVFLSKGDTNSAVHTTSSIHLKAAIAKLRVAEAKFHNSLFPGSNLQMDAIMANSHALFPSLVAFPTLPTNAGFPAAQINTQIKGMSTNRAIPIPNQPPQSSLVQPRPGAPIPPGHEQTNGQPGGILVALSTDAPQVSAPLVVPPDPSVALPDEQYVARPPQISLVPPDPNVALPVPGQRNVPNISEMFAVGRVVAHPERAAPNQPNDNHTAKLHESYLKALKEMEGKTSCSQKVEIAVNFRDTNFDNNKEEAARVFAKPGLNNISDTTNLSVQLGEESRSSSRKSSCPYPDHLTGHGIEADPTITKDFTTTVLSAEIMHTASKQMNAQRIGPSAPSSMVRASLTSEPTETFETRTSDTKELPDLLSGFEKASKTLGSQEQVSRAMAHGIEHQHSPPFTSRSFDDLHCFLGKVSPLHETEEVAKKNDPRNAGREVGKLHGQDESLSFHTEAAALQPRGFCAAQTLPHSTTQDSALANPYQQLAAAANEHSAFVPHVNMFDATNEQHLFFSDLDNALKPSGIGGSEGSSGENETTPSQPSPTVAIWPFSNRDASVVSGSERSDYCSSVYENESLG